VQALRAAYGIVLLTRPEAIATPVLGRHLDRTGLLVARILGARHLVQATAYGVMPTPPSPVLGLGVDAAHASSMVVVACGARRHRRAALTSAAISSGLALADALASRAASAESRTNRTHSKE